MEYKVIQHHNLPIFVSFVNKEIENGWKPIGGIAKGHGPDYMQAMIKE